MKTTVERAMAQVCARSRAVAGLAIGAVVSTAVAVCPETDRFMPTAATAGDEVGRAVALDGGVAVLGAPERNGPNEHSGAVEVLRWTDGRWVEEAALVPPFALQSDWLFGRAVDVDGDVIVVGAIGANSSRGAAYVYRYDGSGWDLEAILEASDGVAGDGYGRAVAVDGNTIVVTAVSADLPAGANAGAVYVHQDPGDGTWPEVDKLTAFDAGPDDSLGQSVALDGDWLLVGSDGRNGSGVHTGAGYVFERIAGAFVFDQKLLASDGEAGDDFARFGVGLSGAIAVIGAPGDDDIAADAGAAYVYRRGPAGWGSEQKLLPSGGGANDGIGSSVAVDGPLLVVGAPRDDHGAGDTNEGAAYLFADGGASFVEQERLAPVAGGPFGLAGLAVAVDGLDLLVGAPAPFPTGLGAAYLFGHGSVLFVDDDAPGGGDGYCWDSALPTLDDALPLQYQGGVREIRVAEGRYVPALGIYDPAQSAVAISGGWNGIGAGDPLERDVAAHPTTLTGDVEDNDAGVDPSNPADPASFDNVGPILFVRHGELFLDGLTLAGGRSTGHGGAIDAHDSRLVVRRCTFQANRANIEGGAAYVGDGSIASFVDCTFLLNHVFTGFDTEGGGAVRASGSSLSFERCRLSQNFVSDVGIGSCNSYQLVGGALWATGGSTSLVNTVVRDNTVYTECLENGARYGGGLYFSDGGTFELLNCSLARNGLALLTPTESAGFGFSGGGVYVDFVDGGTIRNCVLAHDYTSFGIGRRSEISGFTSNIAVDHCFVHGWKGTPDTWTSMVPYGQRVAFLDLDLHLAPDSPCVNAGTMSGLPEGFNVDLDGNGRVYGPAIDLGAYELHAAPLAQVAPPRVAVTGASDSLVLTPDPQSSGDGTGPTLAVPLVSVTPRRARWAITEPTAVVFDVTSDGDSFISSTSLYQIFLEDVPSEPFLSAGEFEASFTIEGTVDGLVEGQAAMWGFDIGDDDDPSLLNGPAGCVSLATGGGGDPCQGFGLDGAQMGPSLPVAWDREVTGTLHSQPCPYSLQDPRGGQDAQCEFGTFTSDEGDRVAFGPAIDFGSVPINLQLASGWFLGVYNPNFQDSTVTFTIESMDVVIGVPVPADLDHDGDVDFTDLLSLLALWGPCDDPPAECAGDLDHDGDVDFTDLLILLASWGS